VKRRNNNSALHTSATGHKDHSPRWKLIIANLAKRLECGVCPRFGGQGAVDSGGIPRTPNASRSSAAALPQCVLRVCALETPSFAVISPWPHRGTLDPDRG